MGDLGGGQIWELEQGVGRFSPPRHVVTNAYRSDPLPHPTLHADNRYHVLLLKPVSLPGPGAFFCPQPTNGIKSSSNQHHEGSRPSPLAVVLLPFYGPSLLPCMGAHSWYVEIYEARDMSSNPWSFYSLTSSSLTFTTPHSCRQGSCHGFPSGTKSLSIVSVSSPYASQGRCKASGESR